MADIARFMSKVSLVDCGCWAWVASCNHEYYGQFKLDGKVRRAHRVSWQLHKGPIEDTVKVLHSCDNPWCVNPDHLFLGSDQDNIKDRQQKLRQARGEKHGSAKFTEEDVLEIRALSKKGWSVKEISDYFDAPTGTVSNVISRQTWAWLEER